MSYEPHAAPHYGALPASKGFSHCKVKELMGHESIDTTTRFYGHLYPDHLHAAVFGM